MKLSNIELNWLEVLGSGKNGTAYDYDGMVLKSTDNHREYEAAKKLKNNPQYWSVKIFEVEDLGNDEFLILKEKVEVAEYDPYDEDGQFYGVEGTLKSLQKTIHTPWGLCRSWTEPFESKEFRDLTDKEINHISKKQRTSLGKELYKWFYAAYKSAEKFNIDTCDLYHNIGIKEDGSFCFFDVMEERF